MSTEAAETTAARVLAEFDRRGIEYCHWKSNEHLAAGLFGDTDLDLLVASQHRSELERVMRESGFKQFPTRISRTYPGIVDYLGLAEESGKLLHFQIHYRLVVGERHLKPYRLPIETEVLDGRVRDPASGVATADPDRELLILVLRAALKIRWREAFLARLGVEREVVSAREFDWLLERVDRHRVVALADDFADKDIAGLVDAAIDARLAHSEVSDLRRALRPLLVAEATHGTVDGVLLRWLRELQWLVGGVNRRTLQLAIPYSRTAPAGGLVVAVIGSDGSGKSSVTSGLVEWLGGKTDVIFIYFGSGDGPASPLRAPLRAVLRLLRAVGSSAGSSSGSASGNGDRADGGRVGITKGIWATVLAHEKATRLRRAARARARGIIVITDRYPQAQVMGMCDGPLLAPWLESTSNIRRALAAYERRVYEVDGPQVPDLVLRLHVSPSVAAERRPEHDPADLRLRVEVADSLRFHTSAHVVDIDADKPQDEVLMAAKRAVWREL